MEEKHAERQRAFLVANPVNYRGNSTVFFQVLFLLARKGKIVGHRLMK